MINLLKMINIDKYLKTKIKSCEGKISTTFHDDKVPKEHSQYICLSLILILFLKQIKTIIYNYF